MNRETIKAQMKETAEKFDAIRKQLFQRKREDRELVEEGTRLQGEYRLLHKMLKDIGEEEKEKDEIGLDATVDGGKKEEVEEEKKPDKTEAEKDAERQAANDATVND